MQKSLFFRTCLVQLGTIIIVSGAESSQMNTQLTTFLGASSSNDRDQELLSTTTTNDIVVETADELTQKFVFVDAETDDVLETITEFSTTRDLFNAMGYTIGALMQFLLNVDGIDYTIDQSSMAALDRPLNDPNALEPVGLDWTTIRNKRILVIKSIKAVIAKLVPSMLDILRSSSYDGLPIEMRVSTVKKSCINTLDRFGKEQFWKEILKQLSEEMQGLRNKLAIIRSKMRPATQTMNDGDGNPFDPLIFDFLTDTNEEPLTASISQIKNVIREILNQWEELTEAGNVPQSVNDLMYQTVAMFEPAFGGDEEGDEIFQDLLALFA